MPLVPDLEPLSCTLCGRREDTDDLEYCEHCCEMICGRCFNSDLHSCLLDTDIDDDFPDHGTAEEME